MRNNQQPEAHTIFFFLVPEQLYSMLTPKCTHLQSNTHIMNMSIISFPCRLPKAHLVRDLKELSRLHHTSVQQLAAADPAVLYTIPTDLNHDVVVGGSIGGPHALQLSRRQIQVLVFVAVSNAPQAVVERLVLLQKASELLVYTARPVDPKGGYLSLEQWRRRISVLLSHELHELGRSGRLRQSALVHLGTREILIATLPRFNAAVHAVRHRTQVGVLLCARHKREEHSREFSFFEYFSLCSFCGGFRSRCLAILDKPGHSTLSGNFPV
jgi:hypothetical protein